LGAILLCAITVASAQTAPVEDARYALTVYRQGVAVVHDRRPVDLDADATHIEWAGIAPHAQPDTIRLEAGPRTLAGYRVRRHPQTLAALLAAAVGQDVQLARRAGDGRTTVQATLVSADPLLVKTAAGLESANPGDIVLPEGAAAGLGGPPAVLLDVAEGLPYQGPAALGYLADGLSWQADYVARLHAGGDRLDLFGRATLRNDSGMDYRAARIELVAGSLRVPGAGQPRPQMLQMARTEAAAEPSRQPQPLGDYQRYALDEPVTLEAGASASVHLLEREDLSVDRTYVLAGRVQAQDGATTDDRAGWTRVPLHTELRWRNESGPLPAGIVRIYTGDGTAFARFLGGDRMADRPRGTDVTVTSGQPFDVTAERRQTEYRRVGEHGEAVAHEIRVQNAGRQAAPVRIEEALPGAWRITEASRDWERASASLAVWRFDVAPGHAVTLTYRARIER